MAESWPSLSEFLDSNQDLPRASDSGVFIRPMEISGRIRIMLEVGEDTTSRDITKAIQLALKWRDRLISYQGPGAGTEGVNWLLETFDRLKESGRSYSQLAEWFNHEISELLKRAYQRKHPDLPARRWLSVSGFDEEEIDELIGEGLGRIAKGQEPFEKGYPLSGPMVREKLRNWRKSRKHKAIHADERISSMYTPAIEAGPSKTTKRFPSKN